MAKILVTSENFCYGSTGMLSSVLSQLRARHEIVFVGTGTALDLIKKTPGQKCFNIDTSSLKFKRFLKKESKKYDILISSMDLNSAVYAKEIGMKVVWLDNIFWYRDHLDERLLKVDRFIAQSGLPINYRAKAKELGVRNFYVTGPIIDSIAVSKNTRNDKKLLVSFGGSDAKNWYKVGKETNYPYIMSDVIINMVDLSKFEKVIVAANSEVCKKLSKKFKNNKVDFLSLSHQEFIRALVSSEVALISPGQQTVLEAFFYKIPIITLPAANDTHYLINRYLKGSVFGKYVLSWDAFFKPQEFSPSSAAADLNNLWSKMSIFENDEKMKQALASKIDFLINHQNNFEEILSSQKIILSKFKKNGAKEAVKIINNFLEKNIK